MMKGHSVKIKNRQGYPKKMGRHENVMVSGADYMRNQLFCFESSTETILHVSEFIIVSL